MIKDYFGHNAEGLAEKKLFLLDLDGTIYIDEQLFDGSLQLLDYIRSISGKYVFITNNSSRSVSDYIDKFKRMGIEAGKDEFFNSSQATALYLKNKYPGRKVYCQGTKSLIKELRESGIEVTETVDDDVGVILAGFDTELTSEKLSRTCELLGRNIPFVATNPDLVCPVSFGYVPDCGSICIMLENAAKRKPVYIGKPEPTMITIVREKFGFSREETLVIGDRLYTDIASGINAGVATVCVLSGESSAEDINASVWQPSFTFESVKTLAKCLYDLKG